KGCWDARQSVSAQHCWFQRIPDLRTSKAVNLRAVARPAGTRRPFDLLGTGQFEGQLIGQVAIAIDRRYTVMRTETATALMYPLASIIESGALRVRCQDNAVGRNF